MKRIDRTGWKYRTVHGVVTIIGYCPNESRWVGSCKGWCMVLSTVEYYEMRGWERIK